MDYSDVPQRTQRSASTSSATASYPSAHLHHLDRNNRMDNDQVTTVTFIYLFHSIFLEEGGGNFYNSEVWLNIPVNQLVSVIIDPDLMRSTSAVPVFSKAKLNSHCFFLVVSLKKKKKQVSGRRYATSSSDEPPSSSGPWNCSRRRWRNGHPITPEFERLRHQFRIFRFGYDAFLCPEFRSGKTR